MRPEEARLCSVLLAAALLIILLNISSVAAARCQISSVDFTYPQQADPNQQIEVDTRVVGSCVSTGVDYYSLRVDLIDTNSSAILSTSSTPIGYSANNFTITARNPATAPSYNATWPLQIDVYVIRAGGTSGSNLLDYKTVASATIQVGAIAVPEFSASSWFLIVTSLAAAVLITSRKTRSEV